MVGLYGMQITSQQNCEGEKRLYTNDICMTTGRDTHCKISQKNLAPPLDLSPLYRAKAVYMQCFPNQSASAKPVPKNPAQALVAATVRVLQW